MCFLCGKCVIIVSRVFFTRTLGGATVTHILQGKKLMYMELKYFFKGQYMPGSWLGPKPPASESTHSATLCIASKVTLVVNNLLGTAGDISDVGSIPGLGRSPGGGHGNRLQYSCLENSMDRGAWWAIVHGITKIWTWLKWLSTYTLLRENLRLLGKRLALFYAAELCTHKVKMSPGCSKSSYTRHTQK